MTNTRATMRGNPGDAARTRGLRRVIIPILIFGMLFGFAAGILLGNMDILPWWMGIILFGISFIAFYIFQKRQRSLVYGYFKGARGEEMVAGELARLPATWTVFNGIILPDGKDVDHIAVGPQGVFIIETKHWSGELTLEEGQLLANGRPLMRSPFLQIRTLVSAATEQLGKMPIAVRGVLCFAGQQFRAGSQQLDEIRICSHLNLIEELTSGNIVLDATEIAACVSHLEALNITQEI